MTEKDRIDAILAGSAGDLDQFAEVIAFIESVDTVNDGLVTDLTANTGASIDSLEVYAAAVSSDLGQEATARGAADANLNASVDSLELIVSGDAADADASIDSLETLAGTIQADVNTNEADADASIDSLETYASAVSSDLASEISATNDDVTAITVSIDSLEVATGGNVTDINSSIDSLEDMVTYLEQGGTILSGSQFSVGTQVAFGAGDDLLVFINGHNIHKSGTIEGNSEGYDTVDGTTFNLVSIGYNIDAEDHVTVLGHRA